MVALKLIYDISRPQYRILYRLWNSNPFETRIIMVEEPINCLGLNGCFDRLTLLHYPNGIHEDPIEIELPSVSIAYEEDPPWHIMEPGESVSTVLNLCEIISLPAGIYQLRPDRSWLTEYPSIFPRGDMEVRLLREGETWTRTDDENMQKSYLQQVELPEKIPPLEVLTFPGFEPFFIEIGYDCW